MSAVLKMACCCVGAEGANGRRIGEGWSCGVWDVGGSAVGGNNVWLPGCVVGSLGQVSSQGVHRVLGCCGVCSMLGSTNLGCGRNCGSIRCTLPGELERAMATAGVTS